MDRRDFLKAGLAAAPLLAGLPRVAMASARRGPLALTTADKEAHLVAISLASGRIVKRIGTRDDPRSIECHGAAPAVVAHSGTGAISLIDTGGLAVRRVLKGFQTPRYTAIAPDGRTAYVTDGGTGELAVVDLEAARVLRRIEVGAAARHLTLAPDGATIWIALGSSAAEIVVVDVRDARHPVVRRRVRPPFLAHDVGFSPTGRRVWVTAGREPRLALYGAHGHHRPQIVGADAAPQHVTFGPTLAYVASGNGASVRLHSLADGSVRRATRVPLGSYNIQRGGGRVLTPSLGTGQLTILDVHGRVLHETRAASAAHDACVVA